MPRTERVPRSTSAEPRAGQPRTAGPWAEEDFLAWAELRHGRHELVEGAVVMQAGASRDHERVAKRMFAALYAQVDEAAFDVNKGDFGVRVGPKRGRTGARAEGRDSVLYPDVVVDLQDRRGGERATSTALVVVEVLSPSTDYAHHVAKLERYKVVDSLRVHLVLDQAAPVAHLWARTASGWPAAPERIVADGVLRFPDIGAAVAMGEIYRPVGR